jgi:hypothetical protein
LSAARQADVTSRTIKTVVHFSSEFLLSGFDDPQRPGDYRVDHDEEQIQDLSRIAWRRVGAYIHLPAIGSAGTTMRMVPINIDELDRALKKDLAQQ